MIELDYFPRGTGDVYQLVQFRAGEPWRVVEGGELLGSLVKSDGVWQLKCNSVLSMDLLEDIGRFIDGQEFNLLPMTIRNRWPDEVMEIVAQGDNSYLVVCKDGIDFERFEKVFRAYLPGLVKDEWTICFRVYDAGMNADFEVLVNSSIFS